MIFPGVAHLLRLNVVSMAQILLLLRLFLLIIPFSSALKFDLAAHTGHSNKYERCIRNFVAKDTLVVVTAIVGGSKGDGQQVNMHVSLGTRIHLQMYLQRHLLTSRVARSRIPLATNTVSPGISQVRRVWHSPPTPTPPLMFALRISLSLTVSSFSKALLVPTS